MADRIKMECPSCGYKCVPQWLNDEATCLKCFKVLRRRPVGAGVGAGVAVHEVERRQVGEACTLKVAPASAMERDGIEPCGRSPKGVHVYRFGKCTYCNTPEPPRGMELLRPFSAARAATPTRTPPRTPSPSAVRPVATPERNERSKVECVHCGYRSVPQWLNDQAHCLKCQAVIKVQPTIHGDRGWNQLDVIGGARKPGEVSTFKVAPGDPMLKTSPGCTSSPNGNHLWKFGKCDYCGKAEGQLVRGAGVLANPGAKDGGCGAGGKCMFKFAKCTKCGRKAF